MPNESAVVAALFGSLLISSTSNASEARSPTGRVNDRVIHLNVSVPVTRDEAYSYFVDPLKLVEWLAPAANVEAEVGGAYELYWEPERPHFNSTIGCTITALVPSRLIAFQWRRPEQFRAFANIAQPLTHVVVTFSYENGHTRIDLLHAGWRDTPEWEAATIWQENAWRTALVRFEEKFRAVR